MFCVRPRQICATFFNLPTSKRAGYLLWAVFLILLLLTLVCLVFVHTAGGIGENTKGFKSNSPKLCSHERTER